MAGVLARASLRTLASGRPVGDGDVVGSAWGRIFRRELGRGPSVRARARTRISPIQQRRDTIDDCRWFAHQTAFELYGVVAHECPPPQGDGDGSGVPERMSVDYTPKRREVEELKCHGECGADDQGERGHAVPLARSVERVPGRIRSGPLDGSAAQMEFREAYDEAQAPYNPDQIMGHAERDVEGRVVAVGELTQGERKQVCEVRDDEEADARSSGEEEPGRRHGRLQEHSTGDGVQEGRGDGDGSGEVVEPLSRGKVWDGSASVPTSHGPSCDLA